MSKYIFGLRAALHSIFLFIFHNKDFKFRGIFGVGPNVVFRIRKKGYIEIGKRVFIHGGSKFIASKGNIVIKDNVFFNYNCMVVSHESIYIGSNCSIGPDVKFFDHDHDIKGKALKEQCFKTAPIIVEDEVWIGANAIILKGAHIGRNSVVAAGTIVRQGVYPPYSLIKNQISTNVVSLLRDK